MTNAKQGETPSLFRPPVFMVGQDRRGNWVVRDQKANAGGLFVTRDAALRYVRSECGYQPRTVIMISGNFELDMSRAAGGEALREAAVDPQRWRRTA